MSKKSETLLGLMRHYKEQTGKQEVDLREIAAMAIRMGYKVPDPITPIDRLAKEIANVARQEIRHDKKTGKPYRANHAFPVHNGPSQTYLWIDIDEAPRGPMQKSLIMRREQMVGDGLQLTLDADHWNGIHQDEDPIVIPMDFTEDIEERKNAPEEMKKAS